MLNLINTDKEDNKHITDFCDPFSKNNLESISINFTTSVFDSDDKYWWGNVKFIKNNTSGEQSFRRYDSFESIVKAINIFVDNI